MTYEYINGLVSASEEKPLMASNVIPPSLLADTRPVPMTMSAFGTNRSEPNVSETDETEVDSGDPLQTTHQVGGGTLQVNWGGVALLGLAGGFFWWFWKRFLPSMETAGKREQEGVV